MVVKEIMINDVEIIEEAQSLMSRVNQTYKMIDAHYNATDSERIKKAAMVLKFLRQKR
jgi:hypothetical protein